jgi:hypothetical protein
VLSSLVRGVLDAIGARDRAVPLLPFATLAEWLATETRLVVDDLAMARDNHHARATKAEAEVARLTAALTAQTARADGAEAEALRVTRERDALRAIVDGRTTPPTDAEIEAHAEVGGEWVVREYTIAGMFSAFSLDGCVSAKRHASVPSSGRRWRRWWPVDRGGIPCAWPTVAKVTP